MNMYKAYLIGAGSGDPGLITVRGREILKEADVVIYDYLVDKRILAAAKKGAELLCCDMLGKKKFPDGFLKDEEKINRLIIKNVKKGKKVVRLKNGDTSVFSRIACELRALAKNKIRFEIVPGVTAASAAAAFSGIPLTDRKFASSCIFVTGHEDPAKDKSVISWEKIASLGTIVLYMAVGNLGRIAAGLVKAGRPKYTPVAIIENAGLLTQRTLAGTLGDIAAKAKKNKIRPPAIVIIGEVVRLGKEFDWLKKGKRILFTGLSEERFFLPGKYFHLPLIKIEPMADYGEFDNYLKNIRRFDWVVFSSRYGVEYFFKRLQAVGLDARSLKDTKIAAIGNSTKKRLLDFGIVADLIPKKESSEGLLEEFKKVNIAGKEIFLPRSDISDKNLNIGFERLGAKVSASYAYRNVMPQDLPDLDLDFFDEIMFTSPSGARNFVKRYGRLPKKIKARYIGDVTKKEAAKCRLIE